MMDANEIRSRMQADAVRSVIEDRFVIVNWGTGVGKSRVGVGAVEEMFRRGALNILLLVEQTFHKDNWLKEFQDCKGEEHGRRLYESLTVECYASLPKYEGTEWDLIIADEAHHLRGENRVGLMSRLKAERILCLSATVSCKGDGAALLTMLNTTFGIFRSYDFGVQDAIDTGILAEPTVHIHVLPLEELTARHLIQDGWGPTAKRAKIDCRYEDYKSYLDKSRWPAAEINIDCSIKQAYEYYTRQFLAMKKTVRDLEDAVQSGGGDPRRLEFAKNRLVRYGGLRKTLIGDAKTRFCKALLGMIEKHDRKYLCFCANVDQAIELGGENVIFSDRKDRLQEICLKHGIAEPRFRTNKEVVDAFNAGDIRSLFAVNMIQEGQNLAGIEVGVNVQLAGKDRQFIQKFGRTLRSKTPEQHIIVVDGTKDVDYLIESVSGINPKYFVFHGHGSLKGKVAKLEDLHSDEPARTPAADRPKAPETSLFGYGR